MKISYVTPTKDRLQFLYGALEILKMNARPEDEVIIQDGGEDEEVAELVASRGFTLVSQENHSGGEGANIALQHATGDYIRVLPDDDIIFSDATLKAIDILEAHPEIDLLLLGGVRILIQPSGRLVATAVSIPAGTGFGSSPTDVEMYGANMVGAFIRRTMIEAMGGFSDIFLNDVDFVMRSIYEGYCVKAVRLFGWHHTIYPHSVVRQTSADVKDAERRRMREKYGVPEDRPVGYWDTKRIWDGAFA